jgi:hypothetical protein
MRLLRYPSRALFGDYLRSAAGMLVGFGVLLAAPPAPAVVIIFGPIAALFTVFALRTLHRHRLRVAVTDDEIACRGLTTKVLPWRRLEAMKLRFFGRRPTKLRPLGGGFMQLTVKGAGTAMTFESSLEDFGWLAGRAAAALQAQGRALDPATSSNLIELGIDPTLIGGKDARNGGSAPDGCDSPPNVL